MKKSPLQIALNELKALAEQQKKDYEETTLAIKAIENIMIGRNKITKNRRKSVAEQIVLKSVKDLSKGKPAGPTYQEINQHINSKTNMPSGTVSSRLSTLSKEGKIIREGKKGSSTYRVA